MTDENYALTTFYAAWQQYQGRVRDAVSSLTEEQLNLRAGPGLRSVGQNAEHIISVRAGWFIYTLLEDGGPEIKTYTTEWGDPEKPLHTAAEMVEGLDRTWDFIYSRMNQWDGKAMEKIFMDEDENGMQVPVTRAWVIWHLIEHDVHHGGEISLTLGMHGIPAEFA